MVGMLATELRGEKRRNLRRILDRTADAFSAVTFDRTTKPAQRFKPERASRIGEGFEPSIRRRRIAVYQTARFSHSRTQPKHHKVAFGGTIAARYRTASRTLGRTRSISRPTCDGLLNPLSRRGQSYAVGFGESLCQGRLADPIAVLPNGAANVAPAYELRWRTGLANNA